MIHASYYSPQIGFARSARKPPSALAGSRLMSTFRASGRFWLPTEPDGSLWGNLEYTPGSGTEVILEGALGKLRYGEPSKFPEIHGQLFNGTPCVLQNVYGAVESFMARKEVLRTDLNAEHLLLGLSPENSEQNLFATSSVTFSHLNGWFGSPVSVEYLDDDLNEHSVRFNQERVEAIFEFEGERFKLETFCARSIPSGGTSGELKFTFGYKLILTPDSAQPLHWHQRLISMIRELLIFLIGSGIYTLEFSLFRGDAGRDEVAVFPVIAVPMVVRLDERYFYSRFADIRSSFESVLTQWIQKADRLTVVRHTISDLLTIDGISPEGIFTRVVQTMEHFHGLVVVGQTRYVSDKTWNSFNLWLDEVFPAFWSDGDPSDQEELTRHKGAILGHYKGANRPTFRTRIEHLFRLVSEGQLMSIVDNPSNLEEYLRAFFPKVGSTRNYLTHFNTEDQRKAFTGSDLERATLQCWAVLIFCLARFLDLPAGVAGQMALQARRTMFLVGKKSDL